MSKMRSSLRSYPHWGWFLLKPFGDDEYDISNVKYQIIYCDCYYPGISNMNVIYHMNYQQCQI